MSFGNPLHMPLMGSVVFFPRPDMPMGEADPEAEDHMFDLTEWIRLRLRLFRGAPDAPCFLFFHGNGETAFDYDPMAAAFRALPATLIVAEYRGYGPSNGIPTIETLLPDAHAVFDETLRLLADEGRSRQIIAMGRSLGSAPAIELAATRDEVAGLVVESGFARFVPLLELLGVPATMLRISEEHGPRNLAKMVGIRIPTLLIHAAGDEIIPFADAQQLFDACRDPHKRLVRVEEAGHNDIHRKAGASYFGHLNDLLARLRGAT